jgi:hypothetical protein
MHESERRLFERLITTMTALSDVVAAQTDAIDALTVAVAAIPAGGSSPADAAAVAQILTNTAAIDAATKTLTGDVAPPPPRGALTLDLIAPQSATVGTPFSLTLVATGGTAPYDFTAGVLPPGLTLSGDVISGTPASPVTDVFDVTVHDSATPPATASESVTFTVS